ncbi:protein NO VEIN domain-containing protein [Bacillaceae bacterium C204]|uniref:protein NO VEIN domain-containing protein n=1 Tax=Neobacillus sp. 204 TaxID=3383351 RepID=UPI00397BD8F5
MSYNPARQFRCTIIRGKTANADNLLPAYAKIISDICPVTKESFAELFNNRLTEILGDSTKKTLDNHRTEIAGKLFGMYYEDEHGVIISSERTEKLLEDSDQPAFFKDICFKFQFPNGMDKIDKVMEKINNGISIRQFPFILKLLLLAENKGYRLTKNEVGYYVLNSLDALQGNVDPLHILDFIIADRESGIIKKVSEPGKASSYSVQHINEQLNYLELANLIRIDNRVISLNQRENESIRFMADFWNSEPEFDINEYDLNDPDERKQFYFDWQLYYSSLNDETRFNTSIESLNIPSQGTGNATTGVDTNVIGEEGENFVLAFEKNRVASFDQRLVRKVIHLGNTRGLGFDIQSVIAEPGEFAEFVKYIEVKTTKRVTVPDPNDSSWIDTVNLTRNEWIAAAQHRGYYSIYRVYLTPERVTVFTINDPFSKDSEGIIKCKPTNYRLDFSNSGIDGVLTG